MTDDNMTTRSVRLPAELVERAEAKATDLDRSVSWLIRQALTLYLDGHRAVQWPSDGSGGLATFRATLTWRMPNFSTGEPTSDTELVIDRMIPALCEVVRAHGADDLIQVDGPDGIRPLALRRTVDYPLGFDYPPAASPEPDVRTLDPLE